MRKILFGGGFDPIHLGHIYIANEASKQLDADVIFLPTQFSIWKSESADIKDKIEMIKLSINDYPRFSIDLYEVKKGEKENFSIDTVRYFVNKYPNDEFYYLIGTDQVNSFHKWKEPEELSRLVKIIFFARPNYVLDEKNIKKYQMIQIVGTPKDISSTEIRALKSLEVDKRVIDYIVSNNLYIMPKIRQFLSDKRFSHSVSVANLAYEIAKKHNIERPDRYFIAGLLHDIGKEVKMDTQNSIMVEHYKAYSILPKVLYHQFVGAELAKNEFGIVDEEMLDAIMFHATGKKDMSLMGKVLYASDKIEPTRGFDSSDLINEMMKDIDKGFKIVLRANKEYLQSHRGDILNMLTYQCFKQYLH